MRRVREHVDRPAALEHVAVLVAKYLKVGGERRRVARDVHDPRRAERSRSAERLARQPRSRRIDDDDIGRARLLAELFDRLSDVAGEEAGVLDPVELRVLDGARDGLLRDLEAPRSRAFAASASPIVPGSTVEVVDVLVARQSRVLAGELVQLRTPSRCSSAGTPTGARGSAARGSPPRSRRPPRGASSGGSSARRACR